MHSVRFHHRERQGRGGGGVCGNHSLATIQLNAIGLNEAATAGGGLWGCDGLIAANIITQNSAGSGGGLAECNGCIVNNIITQNSAVGDGGGLTNCMGEIRNNIIRHNTAAYAGGGLYLCNGPMQNNIISGNSAQDGGGTERCENLVNNTIVNNSATRRGGGVAIYYHGTIANCVLWGNQCPDGPQLFLDGDDIEATYCCIQGWTGGGTGNTALEPDFVDPNGPDGDPSTTWDNNYRLRPSSVCIDRGNNDAHEFPRLDRDGNLRIAHGGRSLTVDMGAFEYNSKRFAITEITPLDANTVSLTWNSQPNNSYTLWFLEDLSTGAWVKGATFPSGGTTTSRNVLLGYPVRGFCRVEMGD